jgi:hypothetical protein
MKNKQIRMIHPAYCLSGNLFLARLIILQMKKRGRGFSNNSRRLTRTVGCCENSIRKSTMPAKPHKIISRAS